MKNLDWMCAGIFACVGAVASGSALAQKVMDTAQEAGQAAGVPAPEEPAADQVPDAGAGPASSTQPSTEEPIAASDDLGDDLGIEEITVTARKREEKLQDVPIAVTAFDEAALDRVQAHSLTDLNGQTPNVTLQNFAIFPFNLAAVIRGIGTVDFEPSSDPAVALILDGVAQASANGSALSTFNLSSVQVLRGPQGTLFGRNATAGAIILTTKRPSNTFGAQSEVTFGNYGGSVQEAAVEGPLTDELAARLSGFSNRMDGYYKNYDGRTLGARNARGARAGFEYKPSDKLDVYLTGEHVTDQSQTTPPVNGLAASGGALGADDGDFDVTINESLAFDSDSDAVTLNADYQLDSGTVSLISGWKQYSYDGNFDVDATPSTLLGVERGEDHKQKSAELRFASGQFGLLNFVTGAYVSEAEYQLAYVVRTDLQTDSDGNVTGIGSGPGVPVLSVRNGQKSRTGSLYWQGNFAITDQAVIEAGLNYSTEKKDFTFFDPFNASSTGQTLSDDWSNLGGRLGLNYKLASGDLLYGNYSRGFRSGGFSGRALFLANVGPYDPEKVDAFEVGMKSDWIDNRLRLNVAAFYNKYSDLQRPILNPDIPTELITTNAASANIPGVEVEAMYRASETLRFNGSVGWLDASYSKFRSSFAPGGESLDDLKLANAPKWQTQLGFLYTHDFASCIAELSGDWQYTSNMFTYTLNEPVTFRESTNLLNAALSLTPTENEKVKLTMFVHNITNEIYNVSGQSGVPSYNLFVLSPPRTFGVTLSLAF